MNKTTKRLRIFDRLKTLVSRWVMRDACWWQFWMPQSGVIGGVIGGTLTALTINYIAKTITG